MKNIFTVFFLLFPSSAVFAAANCTDVSISLLAKEAQGQLNVYAANIDGVLRIAELDNSTDPVEKDLALCLSIGSQGYSLAGAVRAMSNLVEKVFNCASKDSNPLIEEYFWKIVDADHILRKYCFKSGGVYRDIGALKMNLGVSKSAIKKYSDLLKEYQK